jgi:hypothetical protein
MLSIITFRAYISLKNVLTQLVFKLLKSHILRMSGNLDKKKSAYELTVVSGCGILKITEGV